MSRQKNALLSVYNKDGIVKFATDLISYGKYTIYASGGTAEHLKKAGVPVIDVATTIGGGAILDHRVVTISREIAAGLLADPVKHLKEMEELGLPFIDLVCFDFYPLEDAVTDESLTKDQVIEKIDIGGPMNVLAGAKSGRTIVCNTEDREKVSEWVLEQEPNREVFIDWLRYRAFGTISRYYAHAENYFARK